MPVSLLSRLLTVSINDESTSFKAINCPRLLFSSSTDNDSCPAFMMPCWLFICCDCMVKSPVITISPWLLFKFSVTVKVTLFFPNKCNCPFSFVKFVNEISACWATWITPWLLFKFSVLSCKDPLVIILPDWLFKSAKALSLNTPCPLWMMLPPWLLSTKLLRVKFWLPVIILPLLLTLLPLICNCPLLWIVPWLINCQKLRLAVCPNILPLLLIWLPYKLSELPVIVPDEVSEAVLRVTFFSALIRPFPIFSMVSALSIKFWYWLTSCPDWLLIIGLVMVAVPLLSIIAPNWLLSSPLSVILLVLPARLIILPAWLLRSIALRLSSRPAWTRPCWLLSLSTLRLTSCWAVISPPWLSKLLPVISSWPTV